MKVILFVLAAFLLLLSLGTEAAAKSAIHEIQALIFGLIAAVLFVGAAIVDAVNSAAAKLHAEMVGPRTDNVESVSSAEDKSFLAPLASPPRKNR